MNSYEKTAYKNSGTRAHVHPVYCFIIYHRYNSEYSCVQASIDSNSFGSNSNKWYLWPKTHKCRQIFLPLLTYFPIFLLLHIYSDLWITRIFNFRFQFPPYNVSKSSIFFEVLSNYFIQPRSSSGSSVSDPSMCRDENRDGLDWGLINHSSHIHGLGWSEEKSMGLIFTSRSGWFSLFMRLNSNIGFI